MTTGHPVRPLREELDELLADAGVLEHGVLLGRSMTYAIGVQMVAWGARGRVRISQGPWVEQSESTSALPLPPDEACLWKLVRDGPMEGVDRLIADFSPRMRGTRQLAEWKRLRYPVAEAVYRQLSGTGKAAPWRAPHRRLRRWALITLCASGLTGLIVLGALAGPVAADVVAALALAPIALIVAVLRRFLRTNRPAPTERGQELAARARRFGSALDALLAAEDPLPPTQEALEFHERALPLAFLLGRGEAWEARLRAHYARDPSRRTNLLKPSSVGDYSRVVQEVEKAITGVAPDTPSWPDVAGGG
ncbi:hypothetical protein HZZ00_23490 [Streptomyces sp. NEAU-sy36]|uniref:hypothetical protein n=1 Tax=unclassified Streptomyces TaxID=2593676 RepID=UPI0015D57E5A|nr:MULTISPECIES: hypothetical protein [unclassified Streptomyces]QLJ03656.1 hypothetical protein HZZ00_23490 [Streptomyces sp. NEAU-sy36]